MFLKKIEMIGFKSFADRTKIQFDQGITAIVGPNGSGKSNVTESLRWALGEQSAKSLRGAKMPDIIFAGTQNRKALNFAEVIVTFDNEDKYLNSEKEVSITRRLYRNGDSEFLINGKKVRLKDVHDLFTDTGLGRDSFSIISQGKIESIFNSKPEERRAIFEEAAGVLKYKGRKKETESKLNGTQENIDRLDDILYELNTQLVPLKAQRDTALKYQGLEEERVKLELSVVVAQIIKEKISYDEREESLEKIKKELSEIAEKQKKFELTNSSIKDKRQKLEFQKEELQTEVVSLTRLKSDYQGKIELFDSQKNASDKSKAEIEERLKTAEIDEIDYQEKLKEVQISIEENQLQKSVLEKELVALEIEQGKYSDSPEVIMEQLRTDYVDLVNKEAEITNQITRNKAEIDNILRTTREQNENSQQLEEKFAENQRLLEQSKTEVEKSKLDVEGLLDEYKKIASAQSLVSQEFQKAQNEMFDQLDILKNQRAKLTSLENIQANHSNYYQGVKAVLQNADNIGGIVGPVADLISFDSQYATAMEIALGAGAQNVIVEDENSARKAIDYLKKSRQGRATFLPLTSIRERELSQNNINKLQGMNGFIDVALNLVEFEPRIFKALSSLLGTTAIVDTTENASQIAKALNYSVRIVTLDGTLLMPGGSYSGGAGKRNSTTFTVAEIDNLKKSLPQMEEALKTAELKVQELQNKRDSLTAELENIRQAGEMARLASQEKQIKLEQLQKEEEDFKIQLSFISTSKDSLELESLTNKNKELEQELSAIAIKKVKIDGDLSQIRENQADLKLIQDKLQNDIQETRLKLSEVSSELRFSATELSRLERELEDTLAEIKGLTLSLTEPSDLSLEERDNLSNKLVEVEERLESCNRKIIQIKFESEDLQAQLDDLEDENAENINLRQVVGDKRTRLEMELEQSKNYLLSRQSLLTDNYHMSFEEAKDKSTDIEDLKQSEMKLRDLEKAIRALGVVNLDAIIQYEEVSTRYDFLNTQKEDLLQSKEMLLTTISDMDEEVKVRFKTTFEAIRESFKMTFTQMFGGGNADLELTSDDLLEAGVEIAVQPPGKKLASLNLMSGGEKALTALALLFAILRVRTVPFVVLDEVEAALDEANVKRFGDYMTRFDGASQFIVVTHRKGTMAAADVMYGVTMQESGISKIVSVKLKDIDEKVLEEEK
ncbi:chromosome segregation protein SMC [Floricoccus penangensis]|uniref:Chromosome partition protein Smc n=1 Tax=Floricoccus penangensis TaxID=1859475 RepID=A0A9Q5JGS9_9LACT|nr:chromosome segregation protein SMC [Floricoccus penangensis]OFI47050.1 chromosome segregation protein SMC [Floricoccus penangensis]